MGESTFPVFLVVLSFGLVVMFIVGYLRPFVPKVFEHMAKKVDLGSYGDRLTIPVERRYSKVVYAIFTGVFMLSSMVVYFVVDLPSIRDVESGTTAWSVIFSVLVILTTLMFATLFYLSVAMAAEIRSVYSIKKYYERRYGVEVVDFSEDDE